jgi:hypothetical protein
MKRRHKMSKLKPCPFCGGKAGVHKLEQSSRYSSDKQSIPSDGRIIRTVKYPRQKMYYEYKVPMYYVRCLDKTCAGRSSKTFRSLETAIFAWNRRMEDAIDSNLPNYWDLPDSPRFTEQESQDAKTLMRAFPSYFHVMRDGYGTLSIIGAFENPKILDDAMFPSVKAGETVGLSEIAECRL